MEEMVLFLLFLERQQLTLVVVVVAPQVPVQALLVA
jgi:hypothetical protein